MDINLENMRQDLIKAINLTDTNVNPDWIEISDLGCPHKTNKLPNGKMAVYIFFYKDECLKIGKAGPNSNSRYENQHYDPNKSGSNLAKSILFDETFNVKSISNKNIGDWIKNNTKRINILLNKETGIFVLNFVEAYFQLKFKPKYEGFKTQNH